MTSNPQQSNIIFPTGISGPQAAVRKPSPSASQGPIPSAPAVGRSSYAAATKNSAPPNAFGLSNMATAFEGPTPLPHGNGEAIPPVNGNIPTAAALPSLEVSAGMNGNNNVSASTAPDHSRKPSFTCTPSGVNGGPIAGQSNKANIVFGSVNAVASPASGTSPSQVNSSPANLGVAGSVNPRIISPQASPSPVPQPSVSGGRPPSSLQQRNGLIFGQSEASSVHTLPGQTL